jgi:hypothetical protein
VKKSICSPQFAEAFGYIINGGQRVSYLPSEYDPADIIRFDRDEKPEDNFASWQFPLVLKMVDGSASEDNSGKPIIRTPHPCFDK